ncbi:dethiobiotin synthase [Patulibacter sp. NPDC049589]|uniref:dethiobiotin synthase n=1 Tax=Patulibacter sp. NPDC049589 TaxID=3154731 RepID=UPI0034472F9B
MSGRTTSGLSAVDVAEPAEHPASAVVAGRSPLRGIFVTATDTEVGKTVLAAAICARLRADGVRVAAHKPAVTGLDEPAPPYGRDHELLAACTGQSAEDVCPRRFGPAVSPHLAAEGAGETLVPADLIAAARAAGAPPADGTDAPTLVVEGIGGLLVPFDREGFDLRALAVALGLPVVIAARPGLGTINHVRLTAEVARAAGLVVRGVVLTPWPSGDALADDNRRTIAELTGLPVDVLPRCTLTPGGLAEAAAALPVGRWVA